jgi:predicted TIM-barrel fold metal-dependent hydrolase
VTVVDVHTHLMWYPDHISQSYAEEALASKLVKLKQSGGRVNASHLDLHSYDSKPEDHWAASAPADRVVVFGLSAKPTGIDVPNEVIADYVALHPDKLEGWASINPADSDAIEQLEHCMEDLGLKGLKVGPVYQHWDPRDRQYWPFFEHCQRYGIPVIFHQGTTFPSNARIEWGKPLQLEPLAMSFPGLRFIIAHLGHPWEDDVVALARKAPNVWADISACHYRPWRYWQAMVSAMEYGVTHKLLLGSDYPSGTVENVIDGLRAVNDPVEGTNLPRVPKDVQDAIISQNWRTFFYEGWMGT